MRLKIYTDGGSRGNPGQAAIGFVVYGPEDLAIHQYSLAIGVATNNEAEYTAVLKSLEWLRSYSLAQSVESVDWLLDSKLVVEQLSRRWKIKEQRMAQLAQKVWVHLEAISAPHSFTHIPREKNTVADGLVNAALNAQ